MSDRTTTSTGGEALGIGERLRNAREARGLSLAAMERLTKVRAAYLQALEDERFEFLPERTYTRGFLRTYAAALGFNPTELLDIYDSAFAASIKPIFSGRATEIPIRPAVPRSRLRQILTYVGAIVALAFIIVGYIGVQQLREFDRSRTQAPAERGAAIPQPGPLRREVPKTPAVAATPSNPPLAEPTTQAAISPESGQSVKIRVELTASGTSWLRVLADGTRLFEGFVNAGEVRTWTARKQLTVRVGKTPVVALVVNGRPVTPPATPDQVWEGTFTAKQ